jgi:hypothetical protein
VGVGDGGAVLVVRSGVLAVAFHAAVLWRRL